VRLVHPASNPAPSSQRLVAAMVVAIVAVGVLAYLDRAHESAATLDDFANAQSVLAQAVAADFASRLEAIEKDAVRDRAARGRLRLLLSLALAGGLVLAFGGFALRKQRTELTLDRALAVAAVQRDRDEQLARLSRAATTVTFASGMAHELSTPLGIIVGRAEQMLARVMGDERERRNLTSILEQAERMNQVIRGFLNAARGRPPVMQSVDPLAIVRSATALVEHRFGKKGVLLETSVPEGLMPIRGDPRLLEHALVNLLLNACDACPPGGHVLVGAKADDASLSFTVTDDGSGISPEDAARVTEPFFTTKPAGEGIGLGLAITNEIVKSHRGVLVLSPARPRGTCATLQVPFAEGAVDARA
jgi:two-component system NtrC family sensor kinase